MDPDDVRRLVRLMIREVFELEEHELPLDEDVDLAQLGDSLQILEVVAMVQSQFRINRLNVSWRNTSVSPRSLVALVLQHAGR